MKRTTILLSLVALLVMVSVTQAAATPVLLSWKFSGGGGHTASGSLAVFVSIGAWSLSSQSSLSSQQHPLYLPIVLRQ
jgi:hypothetical protein